MHRVDVVSSIPQGSALGPVLFILFIDDPPKDVDSNLKVFADDKKLYRIDCQDEAEALHRDVDTVTEWSRKWQLPFNKEKCKVVHHGRKNQKCTYSVR